MPENGNKLVIIKGKFNGSSRAQFPSDAGSRFEVCFNPTEYTIDKKTSYAEAAIPGLDSPVLQFSRGEARTLSIELLLDTCTYKNGEDVRQKYVQSLHEFLVVDGDLHAPPPCKVVWGSLEFVGVVEEMSARYVMFLDNGTPVRARVTLRFKEYLPVSVQVSETRRASPDRRKIHRVVAGDTLWRLAYEAYGDARLWREIADAKGNRIANPRQLEPGDEIVIPALPGGRTRDE